MSAYSMKPNFKDWQGYQKWLHEWRVIYAHISQTCRTRKTDIRTAKRKCDYTAAKQLAERYHHERVMATKMLTLRNEAVVRWSNIKSIISGIVRQNKDFPVDITDAKNIDFHFNKKHLELPQIPPWVLKAKGRTYYIQHLSCAIPWSTKERPDDPTTKGMIRIKKGNIHIDCSGNATID